MTRESLATNARRYSLIATRAKGIAYQRRTDIGAASLHTSVSPASAPTWFRITRTGNTVSLQYSADGSAWSTIDTAAFVSGQVLIGLAVTSHAAGELATGTYDNVDFQLANGVTQLTSTQDIGAVGLAGTTTFSQGQYSLQASGTDIWGTADAFRFAYVQIAGDATIVARVGSLTGAHNWSKAGVMIRGSVDPSSAHALMLVSSAKGVAFQRRTTDGALSTSTTVSNGNGTAVAQIGKSRECSVRIAIDRRYNVAKRRQRNDRAVAKRAGRNRADQSRPPAASVAPTTSSGWSRRARATLRSSTC